jgi:hypothetical protein
LAYLATLEHSILIPFRASSGTLKSYNKDLIARRKRFRELHFSLTFFLTNLQQEDFSDDTSKDTRTLGRSGCNVDWGSWFVGDMNWCIVVGTGLSGPTLSVL